MGGDCDGGGDAFLSLLDFDASVVRHFLWQLVRFVFSGVWHK